MALTVYEISRRVNYTREGQTITRVFDVTPYTMLSAFADAMLGGVRIVGGFLFRVLPARDPELPWCFCESVDAEGVGAFLSTASQTGVNALTTAGYYDYSARATCVYKAAVQGEAALDAGAPQGQGGGNEQQEIEIAVQSWDFSGQQLTLPNKYYQFENSNTLTLANAGVNATKTFPRIDFALARHFCVRLPAKAMSELYGRVNTAPFTVGGRTWPAETMRYEGSAVTQKITNQGLPFFDVTHKFAIQPTVDKVATSAETVSASGTILVASSTTTTNVGWNRVFRPDRGYWDYPVLAADPTVKVYLPDSGITQTINGSAVAGYKLLFNRGAA